MADYLDLNRYFMPFQDEPSWEVSYNTFLGREPLGAEDWTAILKRRRTVVLAEAGSGKTAEFRECAKRLRDAGSTAFYLTVNNLSKRGLPEALPSREDVETFDAWLKNEAEAVFLVDSVDEARLFGESLEDALSNLQKGLGDQSGRATILISSRVSDWRSKEDKALISTYLGPPATESKPDGPVVEMDDEVFLDRLFRRDRRDESRDEETPKPENYDPHIVALAPLTIQQAKDLAAQEGVVDCDDFVKAIQDADAESLANRPQDLLGLIANWKKDQTVGTKYQILKWSQKQRLREPNLDLKRRDTLSEESALHGARTVAAAMSLGQKRFIAWPLDSPSGPHDDVSLNPEDALPDWAGHDQQFLLNRAIFDPASHGRVRFHHSSAQELLTAEWMLELIKAGCPVRRIWNLLSKEQYGTRRLRTSLRPVTAWLAQLDSRFRQLVLPLEPDLIVEGGDPELLPIKDRKAILRQFAERYRGRDDAGVKVDINQVSRLAHQDLDESIRELWMSAGSSGEVREFLLRLIWVGQIGNCADIALEAATSRRSSYEQALGARALQAIGTHDQKRALAIHITKYAKTYPKRAFAPALIAIYPSVISLEDLEALIRKRPADNMKSLHAGLSYGLIEIAEHADLPDPIGLVRLFYKLLREKPWVEATFQGHSIRYAHLAAPLSTLCKRLVQSSSETNDLDPDVAKATRYVGIISDHSTDFRTGEARTELEKSIRGKTLINRQMFWLAVEAERRNNGDLHSHHAANGLGELWWLSESDMDWLLTDLRVQDNPNDRLVALTGAFALWRHIGEPAAGLERIKEAIGRNNDLNEVLSKLITPPPPEKTDFQIRHEKMMEQRLKEKADKEARIGESWQQFRDRIAANPEPLRDISDINELYDLAVWLALGHRRDSYTLTDWRSLEVPITVAVAKAARDGFVKFGRAYDPTLSAIRANQTPNLVKIALPGVAIDALETPDWASTLSGLPSKNWPMF